MEDARTEYSLPKIWVKLLHAYTADARLSTSSPPRAFLESLGTRLASALTNQHGIHSFFTMDSDNTIIAS